MIEAAEAEREDATEEGCEPGGGESASMRTR